MLLFVYVLWRFFDKYLREACEVYFTDQESLKADVNGGLVEHVATGLAVNDVPLEIRTDQGSVGAGQIKNVLSVALKDASLEISSSVDRGEYVLLSVYEFFVCKILQLLSLVLQNIKAISC